MSCLHPRVLNAPTNVEVWRHGITSYNLCNRRGMHKLHAAMPCLHLRMINTPLQLRRVEARHKHIQFVQLLGISVVCLAQIACSYGMPPP